MTTEAKKLKEMHDRVLQVFPDEVWKTFAEQQQNLANNAMDRVLKKDGPEALTVDRLEGIMELVTQHLWSDVHTQAFDNSPASATEPFVILEQRPKLEDLQKLSEDPALGAIRETQRRLAMSALPKVEEEIFDRFGNPTPPYLSYENYKKLKYRCRNCDWSGFGVELEMGEVFDSLFEIECPKCMTYIGAVGFPIAPLPS
jgi:hypothetical protein